MAVRHIDDVTMETVPGVTGVERQVLIGPDEAPNFAMRRFVMQPGGGMPAHTNTVEHEQYVLGGRAHVGIGEDVREVRPGDAVYIPAGASHWYRVTGEQPFEVLCLVPNAPDRVTMLDEKS